MDKTCAERIIDHKTNRLASINSLLNDENAYEEMLEMPLAVERKIVYEVLLSTGGPGDWFECHLHDTGNPNIPEYDIVRIVYHFQDWFDHAEVELYDNDFEVAKQFCSNFIIHTEY